MGPLCEKSKECQRCHLKEGGPAGHSWSFVSCYAPRECSVCGQEAADPAGHTWKDATCTEPKRCTICNYPSGQPLGHDWVGPLCEKSKECQRCHLKEGGPAGHNWKSATCEQPKTCPDCGSTVGDPNGHFFLPWEIAVKVSDKQSGIKQHTCKNCGKTESKAYFYAQELEDDCTSISGSHDYRITDIPSTCVADGEWYRRCTICGSVAEYVFRPKGNGHEWGIEYYSNGKWVAECIHCDDKKSRTAQLEITFESTQKFEAQLKEWGCPEDEAKIYAGCMEDYYKSSTENVKDYRKLCEDNGVYFDDEYGPNIALTLVMYYNLIDRSEAEKAELCEKYGFIPEDFEDRLVPSWGGTKSAPMIP